MRKLLHFIQQLLLTTFFLTPAAAYAGLYQASGDLEADIARLSLRVVTLGFLIVLICVGVAAIMKRETERTKLLLFTTIVVTVVFSSFTLIGSTIYLNVKSESGGPVHWHADFEFWACGQQIELKDPVGRFSNKIGSSTLHEHNDKRIHLEGVVVESRDAELAKFFRVIGGEITRSSITIPTNSGNANFINGQGCNGEPGELEVFVYKTNPDKTFTRTKIDDPAAYKIAAEQTVPPGDCIIFEFDKSDGKTERLCDQYKFARQRGDLRELTNGN
mgnify:CR=1 FL=1